MKHYHLQCNRSIFFALHSLDSETKQKNTNKRKMSTKSIFFNVTHNMKFMTKLKKTINVTTWKLDPNL